MEIVINKCWGVFGISREAKLALAHTNCPHIKRWKPKDYYGSSPDWEAMFERDKEDGKSEQMFDVDVMWDDIITDEHSNDQSRTCTFLIDIIKQLGDKANGHYAELKIVEIPDGTNFEIDDYDGMESVDEVHSRWG